MSEDILIQLMKLWVHLDNEGGSWPASIIRDAIESEMENRALIWTLRAQIAGMTSSPKEEDDE